MKKKLNTIINYNKGVATIEANTTLPSKTMYRLGRIADKTATIRTRFGTTVEGITKEANTKILEIQEKYKSSTDEEKGILNNQITQINNEVNAKINGLLEEEEEIGDLPTFKLAEFTGKEGNSLVNQGFFTLMGDLIEEE